MDYPIKCCFFSRREWCKELDEAFHSGDDKKASEMTSEAKTFLEILSKKTKQLPTFQVQLSFPPALIFPLQYKKGLRRKNHFLFFKEYLL